MKTLKILSGIICAIGMVLIIGAIGQDDFNTMVLQQAHTTNWIQIIIGFLMMVQLPLVIMRKRHD